jgi:hypothetical protein
MSVATEQRIGYMWQSRKPCEWKFDLDAVREAADVLGVTWDIGLGLTEGRYTIGCARVKCGVHSITISRLRGAEQASQTLWHELTHAAQAERYTGQNFMSIYRGAGPYAANRFEVEARDNECLHEDLPLTTFRSAS